MSAEIILKDFGGEVEITETARRLKEKALAVARPIRKVDNTFDLNCATAALRQLKEIRTGMELTRKAVKAPVLDLGRRIDDTAREFMAECDKQEGRLLGLVNHYQRKQLEAKREEEKKLEQDARKAQELEEQSQHALLEGDIKKAQELKDQAFDLRMNQEVAVIPVIEKPAGMVVRNRINFQVIDPIVFCQAWPQFWKASDSNETLKVDRMLILDELNKETLDGVFHKSKFPEELSATDDRRLVRPAGLRVYEETKAHIR